MQIGAERLVTLVFFLLGIGYLAFALKTEATRMIGDAFGYDPGGRLFLVLAGTVMLLCSAVLLLRQWSEPPKPAPEDNAPVISTLVVGNIVVAVVFILGFRFLGYIVASALLVSTLICFNQRQLNNSPSLGGILVANIATLIGLIVIYTIGRRVVKLCFAFARNNDLPILREPIYQAGAVLFVTTGAFLCLCWVLHKISIDRQQRLAILISIGIVYGIYVLFRLVFLVQLPNGIISW